MNTKHTPGPWSLHKRGPAERYEVQHGIPGNGSPICVTFCGSQQEANARLIAAAPELLDALKKTRAALLCADAAGIPVDEELAQLDAAIAKATGETI